MSTAPFPVVKDFSILNHKWDSDIFFEKRNEYDANDNLIYQGWCQPGSATSEAKWHIVKHTWVAGSVSGFNLIRSEQASDQVKFDKVWDDRATYF
jgi:hypothetical protein